MPMFLLLLKIGFIQSVGIFTNTPKAHFNEAKSRTALFGEDTVNPGAKLIWYGDKGAFLAGLDIDGGFKNQNVGSFSTSLCEGRASGNHSFASGLNAKALGDFSVALGTFSGALGGGYLALGGGTAFEEHAVSIGLAESR